MEQASDQGSTDSPQPTTGLLSDAELMQLCQTQPQVGVAALL